MPYGIEASIPSLEEISVPERQLKTCHILAPFKPAKKGEKAYMNVKKI